MSFSGLAKSSLLLCWAVLLLPFTGTSPTIMEFELFNLGSSVISVVVLWDFVSVSFSVLIGIVSGMVLCFGDYYMKGDIYYSRFFWMVFLFVMSMNILIFFPSLPLMLLGWDGLGITSFVLIIYYQNLKSLGAGIHTLLMNRIGDVLILVAFFMLVKYGHWNISGLPSFALTSTAIVILVGAMTKSAQVPFSSWLPAAMAAPTPVSALVHSSTLVTAGIYLIIRFYPFLSEVQEMTQMLMFCSVFTAILGGWGACYENDLKKVIALSTLSQLGVMMFSLSLGYPMLCLFHLYTHALFKSLLFICGGHIIHSSGGSQDVRQMSGLFKVLPLTSGIFNLGNFCLMGFPFLSGFFSKDSILEAMLLGGYNSFMTLMMIIATALTVMYTFRLTTISIWGAPKMPAPMSEMVYQLMTPMMVLGTFAVSSGVVLSVCENFMESLWLPTLSKLLVPSIILLSIFTFKHSLFNKGSLSLHFLSSMWFLPQLFTQGPISILMSECKKISEHIEKGWLEPASNKVISVLSKVGDAGIISRAMFVLLSVFYMIF